MKNNLPTLRHYKDMSNEDARVWLMVNDKEEAELWRTHGGNLVEAVGDNLRDFGTDGTWCYSKQYASFDPRTDCTASIGYIREDGDFAVLATVNNHDGALSSAEYLKMIKYMLNMFSKSDNKQGDKILVLAREDATDYVSLEASA
jgi:hypothetical protein